MKNVVRALAALAVVALATPALACDGAKKETTAAAQQQKKEKKAPEHAVKTAQAQPKPAAQKQN
ncbi:MAG: hypothetical protein QM704_24900 [Anaeromyxobacteraceae bacterium]